MTTPIRILVPIDFSPSSEVALDYAIAFAKHTGASVDLLHIGDPPLDVRRLVGWVEAPGSLAAFSATPGGAHMRECLSRLEREGIPSRGRLEFGDPARVINRCAANEKYDLVVIGAQALVAADGFPRRRESRPGPELPCSPASRGSDH
jgi:nucleotide-binding universal stress UspA family protein